MKTYFYLLKSRDITAICGGVGGFETPEIARSHASEKLQSGSYERAELYSIDSESKEIAFEFSGFLERRVIWNRPKSS